MASKTSTAMLDNDHITRLATRLGISPAKVLQAVNNLLYGDGAVYRQVVSIPLHGQRA